MTRLEGTLAAVAAGLFAIGVAVPQAAAAQGEGRVLFTFADPAIVESSGLVARDGLVVTVNDSGDSNRIFTVDPATGETVGVTTWDGEATDIEALAPAGAGHVWVADIGDNLARRSSVTVTRVPFGRGERRVPGETYELVYPGRAHDAETLLVDPETGRLLVVTKEFIGQVFRAPRLLDPDRPNRLRRVGDMLGIATDGSFFPDGRHLIVRNYGQAAVYSWPDRERLGTFPLPIQPQGEGLAVDERGRVLLSSEGAGSEVLRVAVPASIRSAMAPEESAAPSPTSGTDGLGLESGAGENGSTEPSSEDDSWAGIVLDPWLIGGAFGLVGLLVLVRSLRPR
ncbi:hypothetical protein E8D34_04450 [Nocardioides sp. GY 10113]|uniref:hypothetical protein n=1 Tax=Nocardioides sp. GY 10113 TaxID=2569761 RepID=UPI0010A8DA95|nr:hypothetical protein [Nocardioides sp. GY 10113]TIC88205.1 hypothetical protein E8D34_04450 [Nocardioides sp. GY 10113]